MFWTIVFAIITAFFGIVLISAATRFTIELWEEYRGQFLFWVLAVPAAIAVFAVFTLMPFMQQL